MTQDSQNAELRLPHGAEVADLVNALNGLGVQFSVKDASVATVTPGTESGKESGNESYGIDNYGSSSSASEQGVGVDNYGSSSSSTSYSQHAGPSASASTSSYSGAPHNYPLPHSHPAPHASATGNGPRTFRPTPAQLHQRAEKMAEFKPS